MTEAQRITFKTKIEEYISAIEKTIKGEITVNYEEINTWGKNLYSRYRYAVNCEKPKYALPQEHLDILKNILTNKNITEEEYKQSLGKIDKLAEILKEKQKIDIDNCSLEELKKLQEQYDKELLLSKQKHTLKNKKLYSMTEEEYENEGNKIEELKKIIKTITKRIEQITPLQEEPTRKQVKYNEKVQNLMKQNEEKDIEIIDLKDEIEKLQQERQNIDEKYQDKYEKRLKNKEEQLEKEYTEKINKEIEKIELKYKSELSKQKTEHLEYIEKNESSTKKLKETKELQKDVIVKLLCEKDEITMDDIIEQIKSKRINTEGIKETLKELKNEIPGIVRSIKEDGETQTYSVRTDAIKLLEEYKKDIISPRISNIQNGTVEFIVQSDLHIDMTETENTIKKLLFPIMDFSAKKNNIPIINLGDLADTNTKGSCRKWYEFDKDAIKSAYQFYKNYAKALAAAKEINNYILLGNHDEHPYNAGVDTREILLEYGPNIKLLGIASGSFRIGNDKIGVYHDNSWQNVITPQEIKGREERADYIYDYLSEEMKNIAKDYIYSLIGHYHFGRHNSEQLFSVINNGIGNTLLFTAEIEDGYVKRMYVKELYLIDTRFKKSGYKTEIYNRGNQYRK